MFVWYAGRFVKGTLLWGLCRSMHMHMLPTHMRCMLKQSALALVSARLSGVAPVRAAPLPLAPECWHSVRHTPRMPSLPCLHLSCSTQMSAARPQRPLHLRLQARACFTGCEAGSALINAACSPTAGTPLQRRSPLHTQFACRPLHARAKVDRNTKSLPAYATPVLPSPRCPYHPPAAAIGYGAHASEGVPLGERRSVALH